jgi:hypothetical protein
MPRTTAFVEQPNLYEKTRPCWHQLCPVFLLPTELKFQASPLCSFQKPTIFRGRGGRYVLTGRSMYCCCRHARVEEAIRAARGEKWLTYLWTEEDELICEPFERDAVPLVFYAASPALPLSMPKAQKSTVARVDLQVQRCSIGSGRTTDRRARRLLLRRSRLHAYRGAWPRPSMPCSANARRAFILCTARATPNSLRRQARCTQLWPPVCGRRASATCRRQ